MSCVCVSRSVAVPTSPVAVTSDCSASRVSESVNASILALRDRVIYERVVVTGRGAGGDDRGFEFRLLVAIGRGCARHVGDRDRGDPGRAGERGDLDAGAADPVGPAADLFTALVELAGELRRVADDVNDERETHDATRRRLRFGCFRYASSCAMVSCPATAGGSPVASAASTDSSASSSSAASGSPLRSSARSHVCASAQVIARIEPTLELVGDRVQHRDARLEGMRVTLPARDGAQERPDIGDRDAGDAARPGALEHREPARIGEREHHAPRLRVGGHLITSKPSPAPRRASSSP